MRKSSLISLFITSLIYSFIIIGIFVQMPTVDLDKISQKSNTTTVTLVKTETNGKNLVNSKTQIPTPSPPKNSKPKKKSCCTSKLQTKRDTKKQKSPPIDKLGLLQAKQQPKKTHKSSAVASVNLQDKKASLKSQAKKGGRREVNLFFKEIKKSIAKNRVYPRRARRRGVTGRVKATFTIEQNGSISNIALKGKRIFFASAKEAIKKIEPINTKDAPVNLPLRVSITIKYRLKKR